MIDKKPLSSGGVLRSGQQVDHTIEIQVGGDENDPDNLRGIFESVNKSSGSQIRHSTKDLKNGQNLNKFGRKSN